MLFDSTRAHAVHCAAETNPGGAAVLVVVATGAALHPVGAVFPGTTLDNTHTVVDHRGDVVLVGAVDTVVHLVGLLLVGTGDGLIG